MHEKCDEDDREKQSGLQIWKSVWWKQSIKKKKVGQPYVQQDYFSGKPH